MLCKIYGRVRERNSQRRLKCTHRADCIDILPNLSAFLPFVSKSPRLYNIRDSLRKFARSYDLQPAANTLLMHTAPFYHTTHTISVALKQEEKVYPVNFMNLALILLIFFSLSPISFKHTIHTFYAACQTESSSNILLYLEIAEKFMHLILQNGFKVVFIPLIRMVKFQFLALFSVALLRRPITFSRKLLLF